MGMKPPVEVPSNDVVDTVTSPPFAALYWKSWTLSSCWNMPLKLIVPAHAPHVEATSSTKARM
jgi:hypothetical protein